MFGARIVLVLSAFAGVVSAADIPDQKVAATVRAKVHKIEPSRQERIFDQIGWANSITEALKLSKEHSRPVFLFTHDGSVSTGRC